MLYSAAPSLLILPLLLTSVSATSQLAVAINGKAEPLLAEGSPAHRFPAHPPVSKRAFDRLDVSPFDFNKRFNDLDASDSAFSRVFYFGKSMPGKMRRKMTETQKRRRWAQKTMGPRTHGFGLGSMLHLRKRAKGEEEEGFQQKR